MRSEYSFARGLGAPKPGSYGSRWRSTFAALGTTYLPRADFGPAVQGRSWKGASSEALARLRPLLIRRGAIEDRELANPHELWRVRIERVVFTAYTNGTLHCSGGTLPEISFLYRTISEVLGVE